MRKIKIEESLFEKFPDLKRGKNIVENIDNEKENIEIKSFCDAKITVYILSKDKRGIKIPF